MSLLLRVILYKTFARAFVNSLVVLLDCEGEREVILVMEVIYVIIICKYMINVVLLIVRKRYGFGGNYGPYCFRGENAP